MQGFEHKTLFYQQMQLTLLLGGPGLWKTMFSLYFAQPLKKPNVR